MNRKIIVTCFAFSALSLTAFGQTKAKQVSKTTTAKKVVGKSVTPAVFNLVNGKDSLSYALGVDLANLLKGNEFDVNIDVLTKGLSSAFKGDSTILSKERSTEVIQDHVTRMRRDKNASLRKSGEDFLAAVKAKPNVQSTPEGVLYEILVQGDGVQPTSSDEVKVHYSGYLSDGTKFDSSYDRGEPLDLSLNQVIKGWQIAVPLMKVGSKYKLYIPEHLAYGERASGPIPAFSALVFEIELLDIVKNDTSLQ